MHPDSTPLPRDRATKQYEILVLEFTDGKLEVPRAKKNENPCSECSRSHQRCFIEEPFSSSLCRKCWKKGRQSCPSHTPKQETSLQFDDDGMKHGEGDCDDHSMKTCNSATIDTRLIWLDNQSRDKAELGIVQREHVLSDIHSKSGSSNVIPAVVSSSIEQASMPWTNYNESVNQTDINVQCGEEPVDWSEFEIFFGHMT